MILMGSWSALPPPIWNMENEHGWHVSHCASDAAIFIGWYFASVTPSSLPTIIATNTVGASTMRDNRAAGAKTVGDFPRRSCQAETASMTTEAVARDASSTCR